MKLLDIDNTIEKGVANIARIGVDMLTLHAYPKAMRAAVKAAKGSDLCLLGVTVLTSMDEADLKDASYKLVFPDIELTNLQDMGDRYSADAVRAATMNFDMDMGSAAGEIPPAKAVYQDLPQETKAWHRLNKNHRDIRYNHD